VLRLVRTRHRSRDSGAVDICRFRY